MQSPNQQQESPSPAPYAEQLPASPASLNSGVHAHPHARPPGALHLTPCTLEQYYELGYDTEDRYELEEGVLVWKPLMVDPEHIRIVSWLHKLLVQHLPTHITNLILVQQSDSVVHEGRKKRNEEATSGRAGAASASGASSDGTSPGEHASSRFADLTIVSRSDLSEASDRTLSPSKGRRNTSNPPKLMAVEVTSLNRKTDLKEKLSHYERSKIPEYVVVDRKKGDAGKKSESCVYVFVLNEHNKYVEHKYVRNEVVRCTYFDHFRLTAKQMLDPDRLQRLVTGLERESREREDQRQRTQRRIAQLLENETQRAENETQRAENETQRAENERQRAERAESELAALKRARDPKNSNTSPNPQKSGKSTKALSPPRSSSSPKSPKSPTSPKSPPPKILRTGSAGDSGKRPRQ